MNPAEVAADAMDVSLDKIEDVTVMEKGMTNKSYLFTYNDIRYLLKIPENGANELVNRKQEAAVYSVINGKGICDDTLYINPENGIKISRFIENARVCDASDWDDVSKCFSKLIDFHNMKLEIGHTFDLFYHIKYYESLWQGRKSEHEDYTEVRNKVLSLRDFISSQNIRPILTHIDANPDNFLISRADDGSERIQLIDWEYAGMQDKYLDIAMFAIYSGYHGEDIDKLIDLYFSISGEELTPDIRTRIYAYIAISGLIWSNWCEYKKICGVDFGEYALTQYRYAADYVDIVLSDISKMS